MKVKHLVLEASLFRFDDIELRHKKLKILIGHTHLQVFFGAITGLCVAVIYTLLRHPSLLGV